jgi:hypothetical protein
VKDDGFDVLVAQNVDMSIKAADAARGLVMVWAEH